MHKLLFASMFVFGCTSLEEPADAADLDAGQDGNTFTRDTADEPLDAGEDTRPIDAGLSDATPSDADPSDAGPNSASIRVASWNIQGLGTPGSAEYQATLAILQRLDADIVGLNEVDAPDVANLDAFASSLGYDHVLVSASNPFGSIRNAILSRLPPSAENVWTAAELSGDSDANDVTRNPLSMTVSGPNGVALTLIVQHWNSGFGNGEEFLRALDSYRVGQASDRVTGEVVVLGDMNAQVGDTETPSHFSEMPADIARLRRFLGDDIAELMAASGLRNDAFAAFTERDMNVIDLAQADGELATRDASGRRIDYILVSSEVHAREWAGEVYDARDDALSTFDYAGDAPAANATNVASDHFPVVADVRLR